MSGTDLEARKEPAWGRGAAGPSAERSTSLSALLVAKLEEALGEEAEYEAARRRALKWLDAGWHLGGRMAAREEAHRHG
jgi:hypothetical protein